MTRAVVMETKRALGATRAGRGRGRAAAATAPVADLVALIREKAAERRFLVDLQHRIDRATGAYIRRALGWSLEISEQERARISRAAGALIAAAEKGETDERGLWLIALAARQARTPFDRMRADAEREMTRLAEQLPAMP